MQPSTLPVCGDARFHQMCPLWDGGLLKILSWNKHRANSIEIPSGSRRTWRRRNILPVDILPLQALFELPFFDRPPSPLSKKTGAAVWPLLAEVLFQQGVILQSAELLWLHHRRSNAACCDVVLHASEMLVSENLAVITCPQWSDVL